MRTVIVFAELPKMTDTVSTITRWQDFLKNAEGSYRPTAESAHPTINLWQLPLNSGLPFLAKLFQFSELYQIPIHALILDEPPEWIKYPPTS
jgi:hypothetical protein